MNTIKSMNQKFVLSKDYINGLSQTDGSFFCSIIISPKHRFGLQFRPKFTITADLDSKYVLESIQEFLGCGKITIIKKNHCAELVIERLSDLHNIIVPLFALAPSPAWAKAKTIRLLVLKLMHLNYLFKLFLLYIIKIKEL